MAPPLPELTDDLVGDILLRVPPDDPAVLFRTALVCKAWRRFLTSAAFLRQYRAFHRTPPLLGFFRNTDDSIARFVPTSSFRPRDPDRRFCRVLDCRHGRALLYVHWQDYIVWDLITGEERHVPDANIPKAYFNAAVMCAAGTDCDHRDCHGGPFLVALVSTDERGWVTYACAYSSESGEWSEPTAVQFAHFIAVAMLPPVIAGGAMYFLSEFGIVILRYDLHGEGALCGFSRPELHPPYDDKFNGTALIQAGDDGVGYAGLRGYNLHLWSLEMIGPDQFNGWTPHSVVELDTILPTAEMLYPPSLIGIAPGPDPDVIFMGTDIGIFTISLKSRWIRKVSEGRSSDYVGNSPERIVAGNVATIEHNSRDTVGDDSCGVAQLAELHFLVFIAVLKG